MEERIKRMMEVEKIMKDELDKVREEMNCKNEETMFRKYENGERLYYIINAINKYWKQLTREK